MYGDVSILGENARETRIFFEEEKIKGSLDVFTREWFVASPRIRNCLENESVFFREMLHGILTGLRQLIRGYALRKRDVNEDVVKLVDKDFFYMRTADRNLVPYLEE